MRSELIIGFDGSASSRDGLALGRRLARATGVPVTVVCVSRSSATADAAVDAAFELRRRADAARVLGEARAALADVPAATFVAASSTRPARALERAADRADAALVVLGPAHRHGLGRVLGGTMADRLLHDASRAVLVAPAGYAGGGRRRRHAVGAAIDGGAETERVAGVAARVAEGAGAALRLLAVAELYPPAGPMYPGAMGIGAVHNATRAAAAASLDRAASVVTPGVGVERRLRAGATADALLAESDELDLLVVGSRRLGALGRVLLDSVTARVLPRAACPVLVLPRGTADRHAAALAAVLAAAL